MKYTAAVLRRSGLLSTPPRARQSLQSPRPRRVDRRPPFGISAELHHAHELAQLRIRRSGRELLEHRTKFKDRRRRPALVTRRTAQDVAVRVVQELPGRRPRDAAAL